MLVGGIKTGSHEPTNQLWTSDAGLNWKVSLPPKRTSCYWSSAVNTGSPENLIVAGGGAVASTVEVFTDLEKQWWIVEDLPRPCACLKCALHNGKVYFMEGINRSTHIYHCDIKSLIVDCRQYGLKKVNDLWHILQTPSDQWDKSQTSPPAPPAPTIPQNDKGLVLSSSASFGQHLIMIGGHTISNTGSDIFVLSVSSRGEVGNALSSAASIVLPSGGEEWVRVGNAPVALSGAAHIVLPTGDMLVIGGVIRGGRSGRIFKASFRGE